MTIEQLKAAHEAKPFRAFTLHIADGSSHHVHHPELLWRTPGGRTVIVSSGGEDVSIIDLLLVTKISMASGSNGRRRR